VLGPYYNLYYFAGNGVRNVYWKTEYAAVLRVLLDWKRYRTRVAKLIVEISFLTQWLNAKRKRALRGRRDVGRDDDARDDAHAWFAAGDNESPNEFSSVVYVYSGGKINANDGVKVNSVYVSVKGDLAKITLTAQECDSVDDVYLGARNVCLGLSICGKDEHLGQRVCCCDDVDPS
jgi:hypothetical protein